MENGSLLRILSALRKSAALDLGVNGTLLGGATNMAVSGHEDTTRGFVTCSGHV